MKSHKHLSKILKNLCCMWSFSVEDRWTWSRSRCLHDKGLCNISGILRDFPGSLYVAIETYPPVIVFVPADKLSVIVCIHSTDSYSVQCSQTGIWTTWKVSYISVWKKRKEKTLSCVGIIKTQRVNSDHSNKKHMLTLRLERRESFHNLHGSLLNLLFFVIFTLHRSFFLCFFGACNWYCGDLLIYMQCGCRKPDVFLWDCHTCIF